MREIFIDLSNNNRPEPQFAGYAGEHNQTQVTVKLTDDLIGDSYLYEFEFGTAYDTRHTRTTTLDTTNNSVSYKLFSDITIKGILEIQVVAYTVSDDGSIRNLIGKSVVCPLIIKNSVTGQKQDYENYVPASEIDILRQEVNNKQNKLTSDDSISIYNSDNKIAVNLRDRNSGLKIGTEGDLPLRGLYVDTDFIATKEDLKGYMKTEDLDDLKLSGLYDENNNLIMTWSQIKTEYPDAFDGDEIIANGAESYFTGLSGRLVIGDGVSSIGSYAFRRCTSLTGFTIPNNITEISAYSFDSCNDILDIYINDLSSWCNIYFMGSLGSNFNLYLNGKLVTDLVIGDNVSSIGRVAFNRCSSIKSVTIPNSVKNIGYGAFLGCPSLKTIYYEGTKEDWLAAIGENLVVANTVTIHYGYIDTSGYATTEDLSSYATKDYVDGKDVDLSGYQEKLTANESIALGDDGSIGVNTAENGGLRLYRQPGKIGLAVDTDIIPTVFGDGVVFENGKLSAKVYTASGLGIDRGMIFINHNVIATKEDLTNHNVNEEAHNDIRLLVTELTTRINALLDSNDTTLDQMSEIVAYIKSNKSLIDSITTSKVNVSDIIDNLTTSVSNKPLSAKQGVMLKSLIDAITVPTKLSELTDDIGVNEKADKTDVENVIKSNNLNQYDLHYYSTISKASTDVTNKSLTNADSNKDNAEVCVWLDDDNYYNVMLLKDVTRSTCSFGSSISHVSVNVKLILNGKTLNGQISTNGTLYIDGTKSGSKLTKTITTGSSVSSLVSCGNVIIDGGTYEFTYTSTGSATMFNVFDGTFSVYRPIKFNTKNATFNFTTNGVNNYITQAKELNADNCIFNISSTTATFIAGIDNTKEGIINNCTFDIESESATTLYGVLNNTDGNLTIEDTVINIESESATALYGVLNNTDGDLTIEDTVINTKSNTCPTSYGIYNVSALTLNNTTVYSDAPNNSYGDTDNVSKAVQNTGTLTINGGKYTGTLTGVASSGNLYVDKGTFVSCSHGGFYLYGGAEKEIFIKNATIGCEEYSGKHDFSKMENGYLGAFYIGGNTGDIYCNTSVYMDNCTLLPLGADSAILRNSNGEHDNKLYISNTIIPSGKKVRNSEGNYLYIGLGTNITKDKLKNPDLNNYSYTEIDGYVNNYIIPELDNKQNKLTAGNGIIINDTTNTISIDTSVIGSGSNNPSQGGSSVDLSAYQLKSTIKQTFDSTLASNTDYYLGDISTDTTLAFPSTAEIGDTIYINFNCASAFALTVDMTYTSDIDIDIEAGVGYEIFANWNGSVWILGYNEYAVS